MEQLTDQDMQDMRDLAYNILETTKPYGDVFVSLCTLDKDDVELLKKFRGL